MTPAGDDDLPRDLARPRRPLTWAGVAIVTVGAVLGAVTGLLLYALTLFG